MENEIVIYDNKAMIDIADKYLNEETRGLVLPTNYDYKGAVSALYLQCLTVKTSDGKPALEVCTRESIAKTIQDMLVKGLNPSKKQCYPIAYAVRDKDTKEILYWELQLQDSYFGRKKQAYTNNKEIANNGITGQCIYRGDVFETSIDQYGRKHLVKHEQKFENIKDSNIVGAYACVRFKDGSDMIDVMDIDSIKKSWAMSRTQGNTHGNFPHEMAIKTVISRLSKQLNNSTDDEMVLNPVSDDTVENDNYIIDPTAIINEEDVSSKAPDDIIVNVEDDIEDNVNVAEETTIETTQEPTNKLICSKCDKKITQAVYDFSVKKFGSPLCMSCQKGEK